MAGLILATKRQHNNGDAIAIYLKRTISMEELVVSIKPSVADASASNASPDRRGLISP